MQETTNVQLAKSADQSIVWNTLIAPAIAGATGALLAVFVCVPYDQVFGLSAALCAGLKYTASVVVFAACLSSDRWAELSFVCQLDHM